MIKKALDMLGAFFMNIRINPLENVELSFRNVKKLMYFCRLYKKLLW